MLIHIYYKKQGRRRKNEEVQEAASCKAASNRYN